MELKLKVCGMKHPENIEQLAALHPDYLGLIFYDRSPRFVEEKIQELNASIKKTGVFVNASEGFILKKVDTFRLSAIQLHGNETAEFCGNLKEKLSEKHASVEIIKVFSIKESFDFAILEAYKKYVDFHLFDTLGKNKGGNGITFNWKVLENYPSPVPFFLSGGIGPEEIPAIKELYRVFKNGNKEHLFYGLDVNSRFETAPALKDIEKIKLFRESLFS